MPMRTNVIQKRSSVHDGISNDRMRLLSSRNVIGKQEHVDVYLRVQTAA